MQDVARWLIVAGVALVALLHWSPSVPLLGKLPGDLRLERDGLRLYVPITTCLLVSAAITLLLNLLSRIR